MTSIRPILYAALALMALICFGVISLIRLEQLSLNDTLWLIAVSMTTVGFGDVVPATTAGRFITILLVLGGVGLLTYVLGAIFVGMLEGHLSDIWGKRRMMKDIAKLQDHIIVCGAGRVGKEVVAELIRDNQDYVVIEKETAVLEEFKQEGSIMFIAGDATEDKVLLSAKVEQARGVIITLADDAENLLITIACRDFNPAVRIVARANRQESIIRLKRAGADTVVCPSAIAGNRMALASLKPASVAFVQTLFEEPDIDLSLEELLLNDNSVLVGKKLKNSRLREDYGVMLLAIRRDEEIITNPSSEELLMAKDLLILCGAAGALSNLEKAAAGGKAT